MKSRPLPPVVEPPSGRSPEQPWKLQPLDGHETVTDHSAHKYHPSKEPRNAYRMPSMLGKKFPAPVLAPYWPFYAAGAIVAYGVYKAQVAMMASDEFKNDPRNPAARGQRAPEKH